MILLINPKTTKSTELQTDFFREPNLGILYLAAILDQKNIPVEILDLEQYYGLENDDINELIIEKIKQHNVIGITSLTNTFHLTVRIASLIKNYSRKKIVVLGGPHVSFKYEEILTNEDVIDIICVKESENSFPELIDLIIGVLNKNGLIRDYERDLNKIKGLAYKNFKGEIVFTGFPSTVKIDNLPLPARYLLSQENFYYRVASVIINRGCPNQCSFCSRQKMSPVVRIRSLDSILSEIRDIATYQTYNYINFYDNININRKFFHSFCRLFIDNKIEIPWGCELRVDTITSEDAKLLKEAGCRLVATGIESASLEVLKNNLKYQDPKQVVTGIRHLKAVNIPIQAYFVLGLPGETELSFQKTVEFIKSLPLTNEDKINYFAATPYPGSRLWDERDYFKLNIVEHDYSKYDCQHIIFETHDLDLKKLKTLFSIAKETEELFTNLK
ncbi:MAG: B12-binding domain-containing radical SAM protein [Candidatus Lokiarchaeota archaeon]|nr:B12-binding domain-containing radical SAM protein [Candidatus Lokiarchaeota archaeon]